MRATRGHARQFWQVFETSPMPMTLVDNDRWHVAANPAARLLFRQTLAEIVRTRIDDLTPGHMLSRLNDHWARLMRHGISAAPYEICFPDASRLTIDYCGLANALPGQHLIVFAPSDWPSDELVEVREAESELPHRALSRREREVLGLIATGADRQEIAEELTISVATVRTHVRNVLRKLNARNRAHAIALAVQQDLIELPPPGALHTTR